MNNNSTKPVIAKIAKADPAKATIRKPRIAKRPFSRLTDGIKHPVTVTTR